MRQVREEFVATYEGKPVHLELAVTRSQFESMIDEKLSKTFTSCDRVLREGKVKEKDVAKVLLVGGSTYIPRIFDVLSGERGFTVHREVDPTYAVAIGAAIQGGIIAGEPIDTILVDVNSHSLGIRAAAITPSGDINHDHIRGRYSPQHADSHVDERDIPHDGRRPEGGEDRGVPGGAGGRPPRTRLSGRSSSTSCRRISRRDPRSTSLSPTI